jgi:hypothetical protein
MRRQRADYIAAHSTVRKTTKKDRFKRFYREVRRRLIADGKIVDPSKNPPKYQYHWTVGDRDEGGIVYANTTGEARGLIKKWLGIKKGRLPEVIKIVRIDNAVSSTLDQPFDIRQVQAGTNSNDSGSAA